MKDSLNGPVDPSFRAISGRLKLTVRRHKFNKYSLSPPSSLHSWSHLPSEDSAHVGAIGLALEPLAW